MPKFKLVVKGDVSHKDQLLGAWSCCHFSAGRPFVLSASDKGEIVVTTNHEPLGTVWTDGSGRALEWLPLE